MARRKIFKGVIRSRSDEPIAASGNSELDNDTGSDGETASVIDGSDNDNENDESIITVNPADIGEGTNDNGEPRKRRGRKPGTKNKPRKEVSQDLTTLLYSLHLMGATMLQTPELVIEETESSHLSDAITRVNEEFGGIVVPSKVTVVINLAMVLGKTYIPRGIAIANRKKSERLAKRQPLPFPNSNVISQPEGVN